MLNLRNASIATKFIGFSASLLILLVTAASFGIMFMQRKSAIHEAKLFSDGMEKVALSGLTTLMMTNQMQHRKMLLDQINETGIVQDLRIIRGAKVAAVYGEGQQSEKIHYSFEKTVLDSGTPYAQEESGDMLRIVKPIRAQSNYLGKNCLGCHQAQEGEILGAITMKISLTEVTKESRSFSLQIFAAGMLIVALAIGGLLLLSRVIIRNPLEKLLELFKKLRQKDYTEKMVPQFRDEVGRLTEGVAAFLDHSIELLTKLGKVSGQLSYLSGKTRETSENFLELAARQSSAIDESSASVQQMNATLRAEQEELISFLSMVNQVVDYATSWSVVYRQISGDETEYRHNLEQNGKRLKKAYKAMIDSIESAETIFRTGTGTTPPEMREITLGLHDLATGLSAARVLLREAIVQHLKSEETFNKSRNALDRIGMTIPENERVIENILAIPEQIRAQYHEQAEASGEISNSLSLLSSEASQVSSTATELAQMAHEASRLALLLKDLLHEFKLP